MPAVSVYESLANGFAQLGVCEELLSASKKPLGMGELHTGSQVNVVDPMTDKYQLLNKFHAAGRSQDGDDFEAHLLQMQVAEFPRRQMKRPSSGVAHRRKMGRAAHSTIRPPLEEVMHRKMFTVVLPCN